MIVLAQQDQRSRGHVVLELEGVCAGYAARDIITDVNLQVRHGEVVAILGANGAGKTTTLMTMAGVLRPSRGTVLLNGVGNSEPLHKRARRGLRLVSEERSVFVSLSVLENLRVAGADPDVALSLFPELGRLLRRRTGLLSGGEQQMLAISCALAGQCSVCLIDELSLGLAETIISRLMLEVRAAADRGIGVVVVEQKVERALDVADRAYVFQLGRIVLEGDARDLRKRSDTIVNAYVAGEALSG